MTGLEVEDDFDQAEMDYQDLLVTLEAIDTLEQGVVDAGTVDRITMESLQKLIPDAISKNYPLSTYTNHPSEQNYEVALESFDVAKTVLVAAIGGILGAILVQLFNVFRNSKTENRVEFLKKKKSELKDSEKTLSATLRRVKKLSLTTQQQIIVEAIDSWNTDVFYDKSESASPKASNVINELSPGGQIYRIMDRWSSDIVQRTSEFKKRVRVLAEVVESMYEVRDGDVDKAQTKVENIVISEDDPFLTDMRAVEVFIRSLSLQGKFTSFVDEELVNTDAFREMLIDTRRLVDYDRLYSTSSKQIDKNLKEIEDKYSPVFTGDSRKSSYRKAASKSHKSTTNENGEHVMSFDATAGAIAPGLLTAVREAERMLKFEAIALRGYATNLEYILFFYQKAVLERQRIEQSAMRQLTDIEGSARE